MPLPDDEPLLPETPLDEPPAPEEVPPLPVPLDDAPPLEAGSEEGPVLSPLRLLHDAATSKGSKPTAILPIMPELSPLPGAKSRHHATHAGVRVVVPK